jgi:nitrogen fixation/metabolism regulation signal transduction histidine kinase
LLRFVEAVDVTIPVVGVGLSELQPIPLFVITILVIIFMRGGLVRWLSRTTRRLVARGRQR